MICVLIYLWRTPFPEIMQLRNDIPDGRVGYSSGPDTYSLEDRLNQNHFAAARRGSRFVRDAALNDGVFTPGLRQKNFTGVRQFK